MFFSHAMNPTKLDDLLNYCSSNGRVCPIPDKWNSLWKLLSKDLDSQSVFKLGPPLILAAWHESTDQEKLLRLKEQLVYADHKGLIDQVESFLHKLNETHWYHSGD